MGLGRRETLQKRPQELSAKSEAGTVRVTKSGKTLELEFEAEPGITLTTKWHPGGKSRSRLALVLDLAGASVAEGSPEYAATLKAGDAKASAACYTKTAKVLPANAPVQKGHNAIRKFWQGAMDMGIRGATLRTVDLEVHGTTANELGAYTLKDLKGNKLDTGKYIVIWKKELREGALSVGGRDGLDEVRLTKVCP